MLSVFISIILIFTFFIIFSMLLALIRAKKLGLHIGKRSQEPRFSIFSRLLFEFPYRFIMDKFERDDFAFNESGFHLIVGEQGSGKTITLVYLLLKYQKQYPKLVVRTNMLYKYENGVIKSWRDLVFKNNGVYGQIDVIDEVQNWFNSLQSKDFPVEMFQEITQQRKQRKMILGTSQVWQRVAKPIREQVAYCYKPITIFGCLTIVRVYKPVVNDEGQADEMKFRKIFFFVHNDTIRNAFDTYHKIEMMSLKGFKDSSSQIRNSQPIHVRLEDSRNSS